MDIKKVYEFFKLNKVGKAAGLQRDKIYNRMNGKYNSWKDVDKNKLARALAPAVKGVFDDLGFDVTITRRK